MQTKKGKKVDEKNYYYIQHIKSIKGKNVFEYKK